MENSNIPIEISEKWPPPNFVNPQSRGPILLAFELTIISLTVLTVTLRVYTRAFINHSIRADDWIMVIATVFATTFTIVNCVSLEYGWGRHYWDLKEEWFTPSRKLSLMCEMIFVLCSTATKLSILTFYLRLVTTMRFKVFIYIGFAMVGSLGVSYIFIAIFHCRPVSAYWTISTGHINCLNEYPLFLSQAVLNTFTDFYVFALPIPTVWRIRLPHRQRVVLVGLFALGF
ncbi:hypothetical protein RUND412_008326, partial [Rhizina undulata]